MVLRNAIAVSLVSLMLIASCKADDARASTNDGESCSTGTDCNSHQCSGGICEGSDCDSDADCREGWTCVTRGSDPIFSRTRKSCDCGSNCPKPSTKSATIVIVEPAETSRNKLRMDEEVTFRAVASGATSARWRATDSEPVATTIELGEGLEIRAKLPRAGRWLVLASALVNGNPAADADISVSVCGTKGAKCNDYNASCCSPIACRNDPAGGQSCQ